MCVSVYKWSRFIPVVFLEYFMTNAKPGLDTRYKKLYFNSDIYNNSILDIRYVPTKTRY